MSSATDRLRELLDERGVEHYDGTERTLWGYEQTGEDTGIYRFAASEISGGFLQFDMFRITPEQAIAATLGAGTCHMEPVKTYQVSEYVTSWGCVCSNCGTFHEFTHGEGWKYCPTCRAEVVDA